MNEPARSESPDARAWWTLAVVVVVVLIAYLGFSAGMMSSPSDDERPASSRAAEEVASEASADDETTEDGPDPEASETGPPATESATGGTNGTTNRPPRDRPQQQEADPGSEPLDAQSLREFGELGVLPGLFDDFSSVPDCDFDDALSTCQ